MAVRWCAVLACQGLAMREQMQRHRAGTHRLTPAKGRLETAPEVRGCIMTMRTAMLRIGQLAFGFWVAGAALMAQSAPVASVQAVGNASISVQPDQAQMTVSVTTQAVTAQDAGAQNATVSYTLLTALT